MIFIVRGYLVVDSLLGCSAHLQVHGIQFLQTSLFSAFLFISPYEPMIKSSSIPILGLPLVFFPSILPSMTSFSKSSPLTTCPIHFLFLLRTDRKSVV